MSGPFVQNRSVYRQIPQQGLDARTQLTPEQLQVLRQQLTAAYQNGGGQQGAGLGVAPSMGPVSLDPAYFSPDAAVNTHNQALELSETQSDEPLLTPGLAASLLQMANTPAGLGRFFGLQKITSGAAVSSGLRSTGQLSGRLAEAAKTAMTSGNPITKRAAQWALKSTGEQAALRGAAKAAATGTSRAAATGAAKLVGRVIPFVNAGIAALDTAEAVRIQNDPKAGPIKKLLGGATAALSVGAVWFPPLGLASGVVGIVRDLWSPQNVPSAAVKMGTLALPEASRAANGIPSLRRAAALAP